MSFVLLADIGGSNSRFALSDSPGPPQRLMAIDNDTVPDLETAIERYLAQTIGGGLARPVRATLAVAAPVDGEEIALTNRAWRFRRSALAGRFGWSDLRIINDFEAIAWAVPRLTAADLRPLGKPRESRPGVKLAIGPGTGLGIAALVPLNGSLHVVPSEGGHGAFGPQTPDEIDVFAATMRRYGPISAETFLSGSGLVRLSEGLGHAATDQSPEAIVAGALAGERAALATVHLFLRLLGRFAGTMALTFKATGGIYIAGSLARGLGPLIDGPHLRAGFEAHPPYEEMLAEIPIRLITSPEPGLLGCAVLADSPER